MNPATSSRLKEFFHSDTANGLVLLAAAMFAILLANTPLSSYYNMLIDLPFTIGLGTFELSKPVLLWVNDGLMAIFFLHVGLELKRELLEGELADPKNIVLPAFGALGGMVVPALIYVALNADHPNLMQGWAIPAATDIAFALGILSLLGSRVPVSLKIFLTSLAIFDDIGAILIIAFFYTSKISMTALMIAGACIILLFILNRSGVKTRTPYILLGIVMWVATLKSGVHATLAGVILALFIPNQGENEDSPSPLKMTEQELHGVVALFIMPVFAFCNAGLDLRGITADQVFHSVPAGIALGLFLGKQIGVFLFCLAGIKMKIARLPQGASWLSLYGIAALCGIGFTMSLFISSLAFEESGFNQVFDDRLGIIAGSLASGLLGYFVLRYSTKKEATGE